MWSFRKKEEVVPDPSIRIITELSLLENEPLNKKTLGKGLKVFGIFLRSRVGGTPSDTPDDMIKRVKHAKLDKSLKEDLIEHLERSTELRWQAHTSEEEVQKFLDRSGQLVAALS